MSSFLRFGVPQVIFPLASVFAYVLLESLKALTLPCMWRLRAIEFGDEHVGDDLERGRPGGGARYGCAGLQSVRVRMVSGISHCLVSL